MTNITADVHVSKDATKFYGKLIVTNIRYEGGGEVDVKNFLGVAFRSPAPVTASDFWYEGKPYPDITPNIHSLPLPGEFIITAQLNFKEEYKINPTLQLNFGINGDLISDPKKWTSSFHFVADHAATLDAE